MTRNIFLRLIKDLEDVPNEDVGVMDKLRGKYEIGIEQEEFKWYQ